MNEALQASVVLKLEKVVLLRLRRLIACPCVGLSTMWRMFRGVAKGGQKGQPLPKYVQLPLAYEDTNAIT